MRKSNAVRNGMTKEGNLWPARSRWKKWRDCLIYIYINRKGDKKIKMIPFRKAHLSACSFPSRPGEHGCYGPRFPSAPARAVPGEGG